MRGSKVGKVPSYKIFKRSHLKNKSVQFEGFETRISENYNKVLPCYIPSKVNKNVLFFDFSPKSSGSGCTSKRKNIHKFVQKCP